MPRLVSFTIFFTVMLALMFGAHYYVWARLIRDPAWSDSVQRALKWGLWALGATIPLAMLLSRTLPPAIAARTLIVPYTWLGILFLTVVLLALGDLTRQLYVMSHAALNDTGGPDAQRRQVLARLLGGAVALFSVGLSGRALANVMRRVAVKTVEVPLARLPAELDGTTIVQLTDVHVGPTIGRDFIEEIVEQTNGLDADLIAITGDLVDGSVEQLMHQVKPLGDLKSRHGTFFVTGNHEYYSGVHEWCAALGQMGIRVLRNESVSIDAPGGSFHLAGVDDFMSRAEGHGHDLGAALANCGDDRPVVLLAHQPRSVIEAAERGVDLQLSGHTHGGQMFPFNFIVKMVQPVVSGLEKIQDTFIYVSNGTGYWGPPMRLKAPAEITRLVLRSTKAGTIA